MNFRGYDREHRAPEVPDSSVHGRSAKIVKGWVLGQLHGVPRATESAGTLIELAGTAHVQ